MNSEPQSMVEVKSPVSGYQVGAFVLYLGPRMLTLRGEEISLEPKVFDVLVYLCANHNHYVSIQELHDNVWEGRIVSDAAVRRSVSKLRSILSLDTEIEQYVKSAHKRGYILDCELSILYEQTPPPIRQSASHLKVGKGNWNRKQYVAILSATLISAVLLSYILWHNADSRPPIFDIAKAPTNIIDYPGEKSHVALSKDETLLAFAGKVVSYQGFQLFVKELSTEAITQLTFDERNVVRVAFSANQEQLVYIDMTPGNSRLKQLAISPVTSSNEPEILVDNFYILSDLSIMPDGTGIVFNGMEDKTQSSQTYFYDYATAKVSELITDFSENAHDYKAELSDDGAYLAVITALNYSQEQRITVYNMENQKIVNRYYHDKHIFEMKWLDDEALLLLDEYSINVIDFGTGKKELVKLNDRKRMRSFDVLRSGDLVTLIQTNAGSLFLEVDSEDFNLSTQNIVAHNDETLEQVLFFGDANDKLYLRKKDDTYRLTVKKHTNQTENEILKTSLELKLFDVARDAREVLIALDGLLALLDVKTNAITYIEPDRQTLLFDGMLSSQTGIVFYGAKTRNGWSIKRYNANTGERKTVAEGFKSVREYSEGFVLITELGEFYTSDPGFNNISPLNQAVPLDSETLWFVRNDRLFWSEFNGKSISFANLDLIDGQKLVSSFDGSQFSTDFDIDPSGQRALLKGRKFPETQVTLLDLAR